LGRPIVARQNASVVGKPRTDGLALSAAEQGNENESA